MTAQRVVFRRFSAASTAASARGVVSPVVAERSPAYAVGGRHPLFGALKGMARVVAGTDLTQPADPGWETPTR